VLKAVLFDFDGTLADTYPIIFRAFRTIFLHYQNKHLSNQEIVDLFGPAEDDIICTSFPEHTNHPEIMQHYYHIYDRDHALVTTPKAEINTYLQDLQHDNIALGIITGKGRKSLDISLQHLFDEIDFHVTIAGDEVEHPKPHPQGLHQAMDILNIQPQETVFVGDSDFDIKAGRQAQIRTIGVNWFDQKNDFTLKEKPDYFCSTITELAQCIENLKRRLQ